MPAQTRQSSVLLPVSVSFGGRKVDMAIPSTLPLVEILPGMARAVDALGAGQATQGFRVLRSRGTELDQSKPLALQDVEAGEVLTLEAAGSGSLDIRYDDMVEAVGTLVERTRPAWNRGDSVKLSAYTAITMFLAAAALVMMASQGSWLAAAIIVGGAVLVALTAAVVMRLPDSPGGEALVLTVPLMTGAAGFVAAPEPLTMRALWAGVGLIVGASASFLLPRGQRSASAGPIVAGLLLLLLGFLTNVAHVGLAPAAGLVVALATVATLVAPWVAMAHMPVRIAMSPEQVQPQPKPVEAEVSVRDAGAMVFAIRVATALVSTVLAWSVAETPAGALLMLAIALSQALGTRALYGRAEVLTGVVSAVAILMVAGARTVMTSPPLMPWMVAAAAVAGAIVLANNVMAQGARPTMERVADGVHVLALMAVIPLATIVWGIF